MDFTIDLDRGDSVSRKGRKQNASHAVAESRAKSSFERLESELAVSAVLFLVEYFDIRLLNTDHSLTLLEW